MVVFSLLIVSLVLLTLQTTLFQAIPTWIGRPDLIFILVVFVGLRLDIIRGAILSLTFGLILDIFSGVFFGLYPISYLCLFLVLRIITKNLILEEAAYQMPLVAASFLLFGICIYLGNAIIESDSFFFWSWKEMLLQSVVLGALAIPCFGLFSAIVSFVQPRGANRFRQ